MGNVAFGFTAETTHYAWKSETKSKRKEKQNNKNRKKIRKKIITNSQFSKESQAMVNEIYFEVSEFCCFSSTISYN